MVSAVDALLVLGIVAGVALVWVGYRVYRLSERLGRRSFVAFTAILGTGCVVAGVGGLVPSVLPLDTDGSTWTQLPLLFWLVSTFPWFVFAVQYTGTRTSIRPRTLALAALPYVVIVVDLGLSVLGAGRELLNVAGTFVFLYVISLSVGGTYLLIQKGYSYDYIPTGQGISLGIVPVGTLAIWNLLGSQDTTTVGIAGAYAAGAVVAAVGVGVARVRYGLFDSTPSIGALGERALTRETDDLMFVVDDSDCVVSINETAVEMLSKTQGAVVGTPLNDWVDYDSEQLHASETVTVQTSEGARQYDPQVSPVTDHHDNEIGRTLSLRDITERNLREQRLAVLNRVLRHNLRNEVDVLKSHAEMLDEDDEEIAPILESADAIGALGQQARRIDQYISGSPDHTTVDLNETVQSVLDTVGADDTTVDISVDIPSTATLVTNRSAVIGAVESALDNAVRYADSTVSVTAESRPGGFCLRVTDDGPGIPDWELESLDAGTESPLQHTTGLGLWQLKWAVRALNGDLSFDTADGTTVEIFVPDRSSERTTA